MLNSAGTKKEIIIKDLIKHKALIGDVHIRERVEELEEAVKQRKIKEEEEKKLKRIRHLDLAMGNRKVKEDVEMENNEEGAKKQKRSKSKQKREKVKEKLRVNKYKKVSGKVINTASDEEDIDEDIDE